MNGNKISLKFKGRDFTEIEKDLIDGITLENTRTLSKEEQRRIIIKFLDELLNDKVQLGKLIVKTNKKPANKENKSELYSILNDKYYWGGFVGIIKGSITFDESYIQAKEVNGEENKKYENVDITLQIQSRFDVDQNDSIAKPYFLTTMLLKCRSGVSDNFVPNNSDEFFSDLLLLYLFKEKANNCYLKGLYKTYQRFEKNDDRLKGTIDVSRHIGLNLGLENGKIAYSYRENTVDNYLNRLILCAFERLKSKYPDTVRTVYFDPANTNLKFLIDTLKSKVSNVMQDSRTLISKNLSSIAHPYYTEYEELRKISLKILRNEGVSMFDGEHEEVNGILFYIPDLWEEYLEGLLVDSDYRLSTQGYKELKIINYEEDIDNFKKEIFPDYVFSWEIDNVEKPFMILDAKFKPAWAETINKNRSFDPHELEDYTKCIRDMNSINAHACGTIFPTNIDLDFEKKIKHDISEYNRMDKFYTFPIIVPCSDNNIRGYSNWNRAFKEKYSLMIEQVKKYIIEEKDFVIKNYSLLNQLNDLRK